MRLAAAALIVLALAIGIVPQFTDCESEGRALTLANGREIPMKCHWTARAEAAMALPLVGMGLLVGASRRRQTLRGMGITGLLLGASVMLLPTSLIGVCANPDMICNAIMRPFLLLSGGLVMAVSAMVTAQSFILHEEVAIARQSLAGRGEAV